MPRRGATTACSSAPAAAADRLRILVALTPDRALPAIGIDVGGTKLEGIALSPDGRELWRQRIATPAGDYDGTLRAIASLVAAARAASGGGRCTIGLGTPGSVTGSGTLKNANSTCLNGRALPRDLEVLLGQPVRIAN